MTDTSLSLLARTQGTESREAWQRLVELYSPLLRAWLLKLDVESTDADDLTQEVLLTVSRELSTFEHPGHAGAFRSWLRTILVHRLLHFRRSQRSRPGARGGSTWAEQLDQLADDASDLSQLWNQEHDRHVMARLLEEIRTRVEERTWEAFRRQVLDGQRADQVAADLGMSLSSVYVARSRLLSALRREAAGLVDDNIL